MGEEHDQCNRFDIDSILALIGSGNIDDDFATAISLRTMVRTENAFSIPFLLGKGSKKIQNNCNCQIIEEQHILRDLHFN